MEKGISDYRIFTDNLKAIVGDLNWGQIGRLAKTYKKLFIIECAELLSDHARSLNSIAKTKYLAALCRKEATTDDYIKQETKLDLTGF